MALPTLLTPELGKAGGAAVSSVGVTVSALNSATVLLCSVHIRYGSSSTPTISASGCGATWSLVLLEDDTQNVMQQALLVGTGTLTTGTVTVTFSAAMEQVACVVWGATGADTVTPTNVVAGSDTGATDTTAVSVSVTPGATDTLLLGFGASRISGVSTAGTNYGLILTNYLIGAAGNASSVYAFGVQRTASHPASGAATAVNATLGTARDWAWIGYALAPAAAAATPTGSAAGSWSFAGAATGKRDPKSSLAGTWTFTSAATGRKQQSGSTAGTWAFTSAAAGRHVARSSLAGTWTFTSAATGTAPIVGVKSGSAVGTWAFPGSTTGARSSIGAAVGSWSFAGQVIGRATKGGTASGDWSFTALADGKATKRGTGSGAWSYSSAMAGSSATTVYITKPPSFVLHRNRVLVHIGAGIYR